ncbi:MAG: hypothetical protein AAF787_19070 [Chloroflexota bacterium]
MTDQPEAAPQPPTADESIAESTRLHRWQSLRGITLPMWLGFFGLLASVLSLLLLTPPQLSMVSDALVILLVLLPMTLCLMPVYILLMIAAFGMGAANKASARQLRRLHRLTHNITDRTVQITTEIDRRALEARVKLAPAEAFMDNTFKQADETEGKKHDG